jgi:hypothetical protein
MERSFANKKAIGIPGSLVHSSVAGGLRTTAADSDRWANRDRQRGGVTTKPKPATRVAHPCAYRYSYIEPDQLTGAACIAGQPGPARPHFYRSAYTDVYQLAHTDADDGPCGSHQDPPDAGTHRRQP